MELQKLKDFLQKCKASNERPIYMGVMATKRNTKRPSKPGGRFNMVQCLSFIPPHMAKPMALGLSQKPKLSLLKITDNSDENLVSPFRDYGNLNLQGGAQV